MLSQRIHSRVAVFAAAFCSLRTYAKQGSNSESLPSRAAQIWPTLDFCMSPFWTLMPSCQQSRRDRLAIDFSIQAHMRLACAKPASRIHNGDFNSTTYMTLNAEKVKALHRSQRSAAWAPWQASAWKQLTARCLRSFFTSQRGGQA
jgi:hypothetical protein